MAATFGSAAMYSPLKSGGSKDRLPVEALLCELQHGQEHVRPVRIGTVDENGFDTSEGAERRNAAVVYLDLVGNLRLSRLVGERLLADAANRSFLANAISVMADQHAMAVRRH